MNATSIRARIEKFGFELKVSENSLSFNNYVTAFDVNYVGCGNLWTISNRRLGVEATGSLDEMVDLAIDICRRPYTDAHEFAYLCGYDEATCGRYLKNEFPDGSRMIIDGGSVLIKR